MRKAAAGLVVGFSSVAAAVAQETPAPRDFTTYQPTVAPVRIDREDAPKIDGDLDEAVWQRAALVDEFYEVEPRVGPPSEKTEVFFLYDNKALYVAIKAYDRNPAGMRTTILERDGEVWRDDMVRFYIDPFDTGISGFGFDVNGLGARAERLVQANRPPVDEWDTIWDSAGKVTEEGWQAEFVIPFRSINFDPEAEGWGLMITRELPGSAAEIRWAGIDQSINKFGFDRPGKLVGITDIDPGMGLDVQVLGALRLNRDWPRPRDDDSRVSPSANISYQFTPSLTGLVTLNTDFSDTPLDAQQVQTGRFSLFFPETRDFFLQDQAFFEFAGQTYNRAPNGQPFFSRRIGIVNGAPVTLQGGAKLSGEYKGVEVGALTARMGERGSVDSQVLSVARAAVDVFDKSRVGFIATHGDPTGDTTNSVVGSDYLYQDRNFLGKGLLQAEAFYLRSFTDRAPSPTDPASALQDTGQSYGLRVAYPNDRWNLLASTRHISEEFDPALGFVNRPGTTDYVANWRRRFRLASGGPFRWVQFGTDQNFVTDPGGTVETREIRLATEMQTAGTDEIELALIDNFEKVVAPFNLPGGITVPVGDYDNDGFEAFARTALFRRIGGSIRVQDQDYFGGDRTLVDARLNGRPSPHFNFALRYQREDISLPGGDVTVQLGSIDTVINFNPDLSIVNQIQYNNISDQFALFSRLRYEIRPETEVFLSFGHGALIPSEDFPNRFESIQTSAIFRVGHTFRF